MAYAPSSDGGEQTRTMLNPDHSVFWHYHDEVAYVSAGNPSKLTNTFSSGPIAVFEGEIPEESMPETEHFLIYPYRDAHSGEAGMRKRVGPASGSFVIENLVVPQYQPLVEDSFGQRCNLSVAVFDWKDETPVRFSNLTTLFKVTLKGNAVIKDIALSGPCYLCGTAQLKYDGSKSEYAGKFELQFQSNLYGNPAVSDRVFLESEYGLQLTDEPQSFYFSVLNLHSVISNYAWKLTVNTVEGEVIEPELNRYSFNYNVRPNKVTDLGEYTINGNPFELRKVDCDKLAREVQVLRTQYLNYSYELSASDSWFSVTKTETGFSLRFEENTTGAIREGKVEVLSGEEVKAEIPVRQMPFGYRDLLGRYLLGSHDGGVESLIYIKEAAGGAEDHFIVESAASDFTYLTQYIPIFSISYSGIGESLLSLPLPQTLPKYDGNRTDYVGKSPELFGMTGTGVLCTGEGLGFDLEYSGNSKRHGFNFRPNSLSAARYNAMNTLYLTIDGMALDRWVSGAAGSLFISAVPEEYEGNHSDYIPKK